MGGVMQTVAPVTRRRWREGIDWPGSTVAILASGPSLSVAQVERVQRWRLLCDSARVIVINTSFLLAPWADVLYACDPEWWRVYIDDVRAVFRGELWSQAWHRDVSEGAAHDARGVRWVPSVRLDGLSRQIGLLRTGNGSGFQAINLAYMAGARRLILLGYDMQKTGGLSHHHGDHPHGLHSGLPFALWLNELERLAPEAEAEGLEVINCTPGSALKAFPMMDLDLALARDDHA